MPTSNITVQNIVDYGRAHIWLKQLLGTGGVANEPGLSICNDILQKLLAKPFAWKFNRKTLPFFVTQAFIQDYTNAGACAFTLAPVVASGGVSTVGGGGVGIDLASNSAITQAGSVVTVNCLQPHNLVVGQTVFHNNVVDQNGNLVAAINGIFTQNTNTLSSTWSNGFAITAIPTPTSYQFTLVTAITACGSPGIFDIGWLESTFLTDFNNTGVPQPQGPIEAQDRITPGYALGETKQLAVQNDTGNGIVTFRIAPVASSYAMAVTGVYQAKARTLRSTRDNFAPWPDNLGYVLRSGMKAFAIDFADKPIQEKQMKMILFEKDIAEALAYSDAENSNSGFAPARAIML